MTRRSLWLLLLLVVLTGGTVWATLRILAPLPGGALPGEGPGESHPSAAGLRVQAVLAQLFLREAGLTARADPLLVTAEEANVFLARHLRVLRLPVWPPRVRVGPGWLEVAGPMPLVRVLEGSGLVWPVRVLPGRLLALSVWITVSGRIAARDGRGEFLVERAALGRQPVPVDWLLGVLGGQSRAALTWRMPRVVERIELLPGRIIIHTAARRS